MRIPKKTAILTAALFISLISSVYASGEQEQESSYPGQEGKITVYLSGPAPMIDQLEQAFEKDHGDVLDMVLMGCGPLRQRIWTELEAGRIKADVFWGSDPLLYITLDERGALEEFSPRGMENLKEEYRRNANFTLVNERYGVVIYNKDKFTGAAAPSSFADLLDPRYEGAVIHADPSQSSTALALVSGVWDINGRSWEYHKSLVENDLFLSKKNSDVPSKIQEGEFDAGIAPHDAVMRLQKKAKKEGYPTPLAICWPAEGPLAIQRPIAISRNENRPQVNEQIARDFVEFMISEEAQKITTKFNFISVRKDLPLPKGVPEEMNINRVDWNYLSSHEGEINDGFKALFQ